MSNALTMLVNYLFGWTAITLVLSWLLTPGYSLFSRSLAKSRVETAAFLTLAYGLLAPVTATTTLILLSLPTLAFPFIIEHCHGSNCTPHTLHITTDTVEGIFTVAIAVTLLLGVAVFMLKQLFNSQRQLRVLSHLSEAGAKRYAVVESQAHIAWCAGLLKPQVYLSRGLLNSLTARQIQIILAHELTHATRKDNLRKWVLHWATIAWPKMTKLKIKQDLSNYHERICDLAAARINNELSDKQEFVNTLGSYNAAANPSAGATGHSAFQQRIASFDHASSLEQSPYSNSGLKPMGIITGVWLTAAILALHFGHPLLEWLSR